MSGAYGCSSPPFVSTFDVVKHQPLTVQQYLTIEAVLNVLFPDDGNGPNIYQINALEHICWVLNDLLQDPSENNFILDKADLCHQLTLELEHTSIHLLPIRKQRQMVESVYEQNWGSYWLSRLMTLLFEALLCDPAYGVNTDEVGWKWLEHRPGQPRPTKAQTYPNPIAAL